VHTQQNSIRAVLLLAGWYNAVQAVQAGTGGYNANNAAADKPLSHLVEHVQHTTQFARARAY